MWLKEDSKKSQQLFSQDVALNSTMACMGVHHPGHNFGVVGSKQNNLVLFGTYPITPNLPLSPRIIL